MGVASSLGPLPAFQCCTLKTIEKLGVGVGLGRGYVGVRYRQVPL